MVNLSLRKQVAWLLPATLFFIACSSSDRPTAPRSGPEYAISDAVHEGGTPGFYFLPPMVAQPAFGGTFDGDITTLSPQIAICDVSNGPDSNCRYSTPPSVEIGHSLSNVSPDSIAASISLAVATPG